MSETKVSCYMCWFDIPADDMERARAFYEGVFGFEPDVMNDSEMPYVALGGTTNMTPQHPTMGGIRPRMEMETGPLVYFNVPSLNEWYRKVETAGGQVIQKDIPVSDWGTMAICLDTEGNSFALWQELQD